MSPLGVCRGGVCAVTCVAAVKLVSAEEVSVWAICVAAILLISAEGKSA